MEFIKQYWGTIVAVIGGVVLLFGFTEQLFKGIRAIKSFLGFGAKPTTAFDLAKNKSYIDFNGKVSEAKKFLVIYNNPINAFPDFHSFSIDDIDQYLSSKNYIKSDVQMIQKMFESRRKEAVGLMQDLLKKEELNSAISKY